MKIITLEEHYGHKCSESSACDRDLARSYPFDGNHHCHVLRQGSVTNNVNGGHEVYRGSKAALNTFMRSFASRHTGDLRTLVLMSPS
jgi:hypothetical protein